MWNFLLGALVFAITAAETAVSTWESRADRQVTSKYGLKTNKFSKKAGWWAAVFEALLYADMILIAREAPWLAAPGIVAAGIAKYWACERRRAKFRPRKKLRPREPVLLRGDDELA